MESNIKIAASNSIRYYVAALITFFVYLSLTVVATGAFTEVNGYTAYNAEKNEVLYHYYYADGEDTKRAEYEAQGIEVSTVPLRSEVSGGAKIFTDLTGQVIGGLVMIGFIYSSLYKLGDSDANLAQFNHKVLDKLRGLKIGLLMVVPSFVAWIIAVIAKVGLISGSWYSLFRFMSYQTFTLINVIFGQQSSTTDVITWAQLFLGLTVLAVPPIIAEICYIMGYKRVNLTSKLFVKKDRKI